MPEWGNNQLDDPGFKLWLRGQGGRGGGNQRPGPGGGFASFGGGANTLAGGSALGAPAYMRRTPYQSAMGGAINPDTMLPGRSFSAAVSGRAFGGGGAQPMAQPEQMNSMRAGSVAPSFSFGSGASGQAFGGEGQATPQAQPVGLTPQQESMISRWPEPIRSNVRRALLAANAANAANATAGQTPSGPGGTFTQQDDWNRWNFNNDPGWGGIMGRILGGMGQSGMFDPMGSSAILNEISQRGNRAASSAQNRAMLSGSLHGLDPAARASYGMEAGLRGQSDAANATSNALLAQLMNQQQFGQGLLNDFFGLNRTNYLQQRQADLQNQGGSGWGQLLGGVAGGALGGWLSPGGIFRGRK